MPGSAEGRRGSSSTEPAVSLVSANSPEHAVSVKTATNARAAKDLLRAATIVIVYLSRSVSMAPDFHANSWLSQYCLIYLRTFREKKLAGLRRGHRGCLG